MKLFRKYIWAIITVLYIGIIFLLSCRQQSSSARPFFIEVLYNIAHIPLYGILGYCLVVLFKYLKAKKMSFFYALLCGLFVSVVDEFLQSFVPGRTVSFMDIGLDLIGVFLGGIFLLLIRRARSGKNISKD